jgi:hypothetical protein
MVLSIAVTLVFMFLKLDFESYVNVDSTEEDLKVFIHLWLVILNSTYFFLLQYTTCYRTYGILSF